MFNPGYGLFEYSASNDSTIQISSVSNVNPDHLLYFRFIGRVVALAVFHRRFLDASIISSFYKMLVQKRVVLSDLANIDAELYRAMEWMLENNITDIIGETFSLQEERFGELVTIELKPGGVDISVTNENKREFVE